MLRGTAGKSDIVRPGRGQTVSVISPFFSFESRGEVPMRVDKNDRDCFRSGSEPSEGFAPVMPTTVNRNSVSHVDFVRNHKNQALIAERKFEIKGILDSEEWHRPYSEALMETEPAKLVPLITKAERAIFRRYLVLCLTPAAIEHSIDLQNAVYYLSQLRKANKTVYTLPSPD
jgi:hypothetical protein